MKPITLIVAVGSLLATPVVFAQSGPQSLQPPTAPLDKTAARNANFHEAPPDEAVAGPKATVQETMAPNTESMVSGSFEDPTTTNPHFGNGTTVTGSFPDTDSGS